MQLFILDYHGNWIQIAGSVASEFYLSLLDSCTHQVHEGYGRTSPDLAYQPVHFTSCSTGRVRLPEKKKKKKKKKNEREFKGFLKKKKKNKKKKL